MEPGVRKLGGGGQEKFPGEVALHLRTEGGTRAGLLKKG